MKEGFSLFLQIDSFSRWIKSARALSSLFEQFPEEIDLCTLIKVYSFLVGIAPAGIHRRNSLFIGFFGVARLPFLKPERCQQASAPLRTDQP